MYRYLSFFSCIALLASLSFAMFACDNPECSVNSQCGNTDLCRSNKCVPKCVTYKTCAEGEACVEGACEIPTADFCSDIAPTLAPEMGVYEPCPPQSATAGMEAGTADTEMTPEAGMATEGK